MAANNTLVELNHNVIGILTGYGAAPTGFAKRTELMERVLDLRNCISYRIEAIIFHQEVIDTYWPKIQEWLISHLVNNKGKEPEKTFLNAQDTLLFIFDDIIFNIISLVDYFGNLISVIYSGEQYRNKKWKGLLNLINNKEDKLPIDDLIIQHNKDWVNDLTEYRAKIFHYDRDKTKTIIYGIYGGVSTYVATPKKFIKSMKNFPTDLSMNDQPPHLIKSCDWLISKTSDTFNNILELIKEDKL